MEYTQLDIDTLVTKKSKLTTASKKYTSCLITSIIGCLIGGPIGLLISNLFHMGLSISIITEILSVVFTITTGNLLRKSYCMSKIQRLFKSTHDNPPSETISLINQCFYNNDQIGQENHEARDDRDDQENLVNLEDRLKKILSNLITLLETDPWLSKWYNNLLKTFYKQKRLYLIKNKNKHNENIGLIRITLDTMFNTLVKLLIISNNGVKLEKDDIITIYSISERILMMSLYNDLWDMARNKSKLYDKLYIQNASKFQLEIKIDSEIIKLLNRVPLKKTASHRVTILITVCEMINNNEYIDCDDLLIGFINHLVVSNIRYPFSEFIIMETLLPKELKGIESYAISTFLSSAYYIMKL